MAAAKKVALTDRFLKALKPAPQGKRFIIWDAVQPHLGVRVTDNGHRSFVVVMRRAGESKPTRYFLGTYPTTSLAEARLSTPKIISAFLNGQDPKEQERQKLREAQIREGTKFDVVAEDYIKRHLSKLKSQRSITLTLKRELLGLRLHRVKKDGKYQDEWRNGPDPRWRDIPIATITRRNVVELLEKISDGGSRYQARKVFAILSKLFKWAILRDIYGLETSPVAIIRHTDVLGVFKSRSRVLSDSELRLVWNAAKATPYPFGTVVQVLMLTGQRLREVSSACWSEIDDGLLVIPAERMKAKIPHTVPLTSRVLSIITTLPRFQENSGHANDGYLFTTTSGKRPISGFSKMKKRLDTSIEENRIANGDNELPMTPWTLHDLRRTVRTRMSGLGILPLVAELVIGHKQTGIHAVYDLHTYDGEKRAALALWEAKLLQIVGEASSTSSDVAEHPLTRPLRDIAA